MAIGRPEYENATCSEQSNWKVRIKVATHLGGLQVKKSRCTKVEGTVVRVHLHLHPHLRLLPHSGCSCIIFRAFGLVVFGLTFTKTTSLRFTASIYHIRALTIVRPNWNTPPTLHESACVALLKARGPVLPCPLHSTIDPRSTQWLPTTRVRALLPQSCQLSLLCKVMRRERTRRELTTSSRSFKSRQKPGT